MLAALFLAACMTGPTTTTTAPQTPEQAYYAAKSSYSIAVEEAATYAALPFCTDTLVVQCADPVTVIKLDNAVDAANEAFETADLVFQAPDMDTTSEAQALNAATVALRTLTAILATAVVKEASS
jgi:hypothetical protein